jgi:hypothetical protein
MQQMERDPWLVPPSRSSKRRRRLDFSRGASKGCPTRFWRRESPSACERVGLAASTAVGINVTIFNPELDRNGLIATAFVHALELGLRRETQL